MISAVMKWPFHHRAYYCYLAMSIWIFLLISVTYNFMNVVSEKKQAKHVIQKHIVSQTELKFQNLYNRMCNPPDNIVRGSEAAIDPDSWTLHGVLAITRHGDRGPLTHLRNGDKLPCDVVPESLLLKSYETYVQNISGGYSRGPWASGPGPFHSFPTLPVRHSANTHCPLGQLTSVGLLQMLSVGAIFKEAYAEKLRLNIESANRRDKGDIISWSTRYRRTYQSLLGVLWPLSGPNMVKVSSRCKESHSVAFCFQDCACAAHTVLSSKINAQTKSRFDAHPTIKDLVSKISKVLFETNEIKDPEFVKDALLAYMCHEAPLPCVNHINVQRKIQNVNDEIVKQRKILNFDDINVDYDFNKKTKEVYDERDRKLDFDSEVEREKVQYYQQKFLEDDEGNDDMDTPEERSIDNDFCVKKEHVISVLTYLEWSHRKDSDNIYCKRKGLLVAYGLVHNIVKYMIKMISENKPKFVLYSGHDKTLEPLLYALGLKQRIVKYASRLIFEIYRSSDLRDDILFEKRNPVAQDFYFRVVFDGSDVTNDLSFCHSDNLVLNKVVDPTDHITVYNTYLCPLESIVRYIHDDYFAVFNASNYKDACSTGKKKTQV